VIKVENLTKKYAGFTAINNISFEVGKGEIVGFLGPNGAGKSTTMRILSSFMPATSGRASIAGYDVFENSMVGDVKELCGLADVENRIVNTLSKGYRQRVGLADALVHEPDLLILDEPTIGLDPNQIRSVRELIKNLGRHHTILISTHILPEFEATCSRVIIINRGRIEASDTPDNLRRQLRGAGGIRLEANPGNEDGVAELQKIAGVKDVTVTEDGEWKLFLVRAEANVDLREEVFRLAADRRWRVRELAQRGATLEDVFVEMTHADH
jgi:ABC-2 type transport system ATP-binding protein